jgi:hypothetical protein
MVSETDAADSSMPLKQLDASSSSHHEGIAAVVQLLALPSPVTKRRSTQKRTRSSKSAGRNSSRVTVELSQQPLPNILADPMPDGDVAPQAVQSEGVKAPTQPEMLVAPSVESSKKRGRRRPQKSKAISSEFVVEEDEAVIEVIPTDNDDEQDPDIPKPLQEIDMNVHTALPVSNHEGATKDIENLQAVAPEVAEPAIPTKSEIARLPKGGSPQTSGSTPYRVGLSKRARIPSLLKVVRK